MTSEYTYRDSHKASDKGFVYDQHYDMVPWQVFCWSREQKVLSEILAKYYESRDIHLLDFACGTGRITNFLETRVTTSTAVDVSSSMLDVARKKLSHTQILEGDITSGPLLKGEKFNLITAFRFFLNAEPQLRLAVIKSLAELLSEDGYLVFNNHRNVRSLWVKLLYMYNRIRHPEGMFNVMTLKQIRELTASAGLEIEAVYPVGFFHLPKIPVSQRLTGIIEDICCKFKYMAQFSESPIVVCKRSQNGPANN